MHHIKVKIKMIILVVLVFLSLTFITLLSLGQGSYMINRNVQRLREEFFNNYDMSIKQQVNVAISLLEIAQKRYKSGELTLEEAKTFGADIIRELRYTEGGYFWIDTTEGVNIVLLGSDTEGTNRYNNKDANGVPLIQNIIKEGMKEGGGYTNYMFPKEGETKPSPKRSYSKLFEPFQWVVGTGNYVDDMEEEINSIEKQLNQDFRQFQGIIVIILLITLILIGGISYLIAYDVVSSVKLSCSYLGKVGAGDFSVSLPAVFLNRRDDFGLLASSINQMKQSVSHLINKIKEETEIIHEVVKEVKINANGLNDNIQNVSATTEQLAAGMEQTAASTEEMLATVHVMETAVHNISKSSQEGTTKAMKISKRASETKESVVNSQKRASEIQESISQKLEVALGQSKVVEEIRVLADAIMSITTKTNLLALNAAIEAARAGESGKGFSVVAEEIRTLAEQSKDSVVKIQEVTNRVTDAVDFLADNSKSLLDYVSKEVANDYEYMLLVAEKYNGDSKFVDDLAKQFSETAEHLFTVIQNVTQGVHDISIAAGEGAEGTTDIAAKNMDITVQSGEVLALVSKTQESASHLQEEIDKFII